MMVCVEIKASMPPDRLPFDTLIEKLLEENPQCMAVFLKYQMGCVGCAMSAFDTLADVIRIYKLPQEAFLSDLYHALDTPNPSPE